MKKLVLLLSLFIGASSLAQVKTMTQEEFKKIVESVNNLDLTQLKYYPNPTDSELNISYVEAITKVEVFTISGQRVLTKEFDANQVKIDLSSLGLGTYMVRIETETASQFIKVVKKWKRI